ncbi:MAG: hypothetical protein Q8P48_00105 [Deltaproteobacteria bacterium]|nr:hypothetical protein [Deltaproteobacteria bacterium]
MKIYNLPRLAETSPNGEYRLGPAEADTGSVYILYGRLRPGEADHKLALPEGHEEIICVIKGEITVSCGKKSFTVSAGEAFNPGPAKTLSLDNAAEGEAIYISARGCPARGEAKPEPAGKPSPETQPRARDEKAEEDEFEITNDGVRLEE